MAPIFPSPITVLLQGETGTGKEIIARAIQYHGPRQDRPFVAVNCGALTETLLESELFGYKKGAFTGAMTDKAGFFEVAHGGTIFFDEIGDTSTAMQVKLLPVLQEGEIRRVGETQMRRVDVRVISTTNKDLAEEVRQQRFREDLYYRLNVFPIHVPPLRERREDIPLLGVAISAAQRQTVRQARAGHRAPSHSALDAVPLAWKSPRVAQRDRTGGGAGPGRRRHHPGVPVGENRAAACCASGAG